MTALLIPDEPTGSNVADAARLRELLPALRKLPGCPEGTDEAILAMSNPPGHTACPNPFLDGWLPGPHDDDETRPDPGPFATDTTAGKTSLVYKAHAYPTKVPHEAIMRLLLHYTKPGDVVLDGFCGTGMTGVAAQMCGAPSADLKVQIESELGPVHWGTRKAVLQDLSPSATFIAAGLNLPIDAKRFDRASAAILDRFDKEWGWMYETTMHDSKGSYTAKIDYTIWSEVFTCPHCGGEVVFYDVAYEPTTGEVKDEFSCSNCGATANKHGLKRRLAKIRTMTGDVIDRIEFRPVSIGWRSGKNTGFKSPDSGDLDTLRRVAQSHTPHFPSDPLPLDQMTHGSRLGPKGFRYVHHLWPDRALVALAALWQSASEEPDPGLRRALRFWLDQSFWGLSWMNRFRGNGYSHVNQQMTGVYYIPALQAECSVRYNLEGTNPRRGKRQNLGKLWGDLRVSEHNVRISTGSSTAVRVPNNSIDYIFVDPPFGANIPYSDLALVVEEWHGVTTAVAEEAIQDDKRHKGLFEYAGLMERCFQEFHRALKPGRWMTVEFSNSSNDVWLAIQHGLSRAGFVVADTRVFDKEQHSYRQVTASNAVKRDLIISAYKPAVMVAERVGIEKGSEEGVRAFLSEHLAHLPTTNGSKGEARVIRERQGDRLYDRMVAYHVAREIGVPMTTAEFNSAIDRWFVQRDTMYFLPNQAHEWERFRLASRDIEQADLFITNEGSALQWLRQFLAPKPRPYAEIQPVYFAETQKGTTGWEQLPDLRALLDQAFVTDEQGRWCVPDPKRAEDLEQLRFKELLKVFETYTGGTRPLERFRSEAVKAGFKNAWASRDYSTIVKVGNRLPHDAFAEDPALLHYYRNAERMVTPRAMP